MKFFAILLFLVSSTVAWRPWDEPCANQRSSLCFLSFIWCKGRTNGECYYPDGVYPGHENAGQTPALIWGKDYEINWTTSKKGPVTVRWIMSDYDNDSDGVGPLDRVVWEKNVTDGELGFLFSPRSTMFPNPRAPNLTAQTVPGFAIGFSQLQIEQFSTNSTNHTTSKGAIDVSDRFYIYPRNALDAINYAVDKEKNRGEKKLKLGVGSGVGLSLLVGIVATWFLAGWWTRRSMRKRETVRVKA